MDDRIDSTAPEIPVVLASVSPRRHALLAKTGIAFETVSSPAEEIHDGKLAAEVLCEENARLKAAAVADFRPDAIVIGADTLVFVDGQPLGKPADLAAARAMLTRLSGRSHWVCTGVCVILPGGGIRQFHELTEVTFLPLDAVTIDQYLALTNPLDKAGAYGIQDRGEMIVSSISGSFENVMGLPVERLISVLQEIGLPCGRDFADTACHGDTAPLSPDI
jgi:septum formation protein